MPHDGYAAFWHLFVEKSWTNDLGEPMGRVVKSTTFSGGKRYTAYKDSGGGERRVGIFRNEKDAEQAWQRAESKDAEGRAGTRRRER